MKALKIIQKLQYNTYTLEEKDTKKQYHLSLEFYDDVIADIGDYLLIDEKLLDPNYVGFCQPYAFGRTNKSVEEIKGNLDYVVLHKNKFNVVLERLYG